MERHRCFLFFRPRRRSVTGAGPGAYFLLPLHSHTSRLRGTAMKFLIIDDSVSLRSLLKKRLLQRWPEAVITGYDPLREGRPGNAFPWGTFDIVFLDYDIGLVQETGIDWL